MTIRARVKPAYPIVLQGTGGVTVEQEGGVATIDFDYENSELGIDLNNAVTAAEAAQAAAEAAAAAAAAEALRTYPTRDQVEAETIAADVLSLNVRGLSTEGDGGHEFYVKVDDEPDHEGKVQSLDGAWWSIISHIVRPEAFRAYTGTDDTLALQYCAEYIRDRGGGGIEFHPDRTYNIPDDGAGHISGIANFGPLMDFDASCKGVTVAGNGAKLLVGNVTDGVRIFWMNGCENFRIENLRGESQYTTLHSTLGVHWLAAINGAKRLYFSNLDFVSGSVGLQCLGITGGALSDTNRVEQVELHNANFTKVYYPMSFPHAGDHFFARGVVTRNCGRAYFPYNVTDHDVQVDSQHGSVFTDCLLKCYGSTDHFSQLKNIKLDYQSDSKFAGSGDQSAQEAMIALDAQLSETNPAPVVITGIDITFNVACSLADKHQSVFVTRKYSDLGVFDDTARGHTYNGIKIRGFAADAQNLLAGAIELFTLNDWTNERITNVVLEELLIPSLDTDTSVHVDGRGIVSGTPGIIVRDCICSGLITKTNVSGRGYSETNSSFENSITVTDWP